MEQQITIDKVHGNPNLNIRTGTTNGVSKKCTEHTKSSRFKGTMSWDFLLQVFFMNHLPPPQAPENNARVISYFFENTRRYSQVNVHHRYHRHRWCTLRREFSKKFETALMVYSGTWGETIHKKNLKSKILWHCPFKNHSFQTNDDLSQLRRFLPVFLGPLTKAHSTAMVWPRISLLSSSSLAASASLYVSYSTRAYPFRKPVRRSRFKWIF